MNVMVKSTGFTPSSVGEQPHFSLLITWPATKLWRSGRQHQGQKWLVLHCLSLVKYYSYTSRGNQSAVDSCRISHTPHSYTDERGSVSDFTGSGRAPCYILISVFRGKRCMPPANQCAGERFTHPAALLLFAFRDIETWIFRGWVNHGSLQHITSPEAEEAKAGFQHISKNRIDIVSSSACFWTNRFCLDMNIPFLSKNLLNVSVSEIWTWSMFCVFWRSSIFPALFACLMQVIISSHSCHDFRTFMALCFS